MSRPATRKHNPDSDLIGLLEAAIAERRGDITGAAASLQRALVIQKRDNTDEYIPLFPAGPALGALYIRAGRYADARALFALALACTKLGDGPCATASNTQFNAIWHGPPPSITDL